MAESLEQEFKVRPHQSVAFRDDVRSLKASACQVDRGNNATLGKLSSCQTLVDKLREPLAKMMAESLEQDFKVKPDQWHAGGEATLEGGESETALAAQV